MGRIARFKRTINRTVGHCEDNETDTVNRWEHRDSDVVVTITIATYPTSGIKITEDGPRATYHAEYWVEVSGTVCMDGGGPDAPFDSVHGNIDEARRAAHSLMHDIGYDNRGMTPQEEPAPESAPEPEEASAGIGSW